MKLLYATSIDLPSTRANRVQIVSMSRAFHGLLGGSFLLGLQKNRGEPLDFPVAEMLRERSFSLAWTYLRLAKQHEITHIYCREEKMLFFLLFFNRVFFRLQIKFFYELHDFWHEGWWYRMLMQRVDGVIVITHGLKAGLVADGYAQAKVMVSPDAVDVALFDIPLAKEEARRVLGLPLNKPIALYAGAIDEPWKGAGVFYGASKYLGDACLMVLVGGKPHYVESFQKEFPPVPQVRMEGYKDYATELPAYLKSADILVVPNSAKQEISRISTSPLKVFAYMAAGRPIVASDLPSIREVLNETNSLLVEPDSPQALAEGIRSLMHDPLRAGELAARARLDVESYTWNKRAKDVLAFLIA